MLPKPNSRTDQPVWPDIFVKISDILQFLRKNFYVISTFFEIITINLIGPCLAALAGLRNAKSLIKAGQTAHRLYRPDNQSKSLTISGFIRTLRNDNGI